MIMDISHPRAMDGNESQFGSITVRCVVDGSGFVLSMGSKPIKPAPCPRSCPGGGGWVCDVVNVPCQTL